MFRSLAVPLALAVLAGCAGVPGRDVAGPPAACAPGSCPACPGVEPPKPAAKPLEAAGWNDLPGWPEEDLAPALKTFANSCEILGKRALWRDACSAARAALAGSLAGPALRNWFDTGYYEPVLRGSRVRHPPYINPLYRVPDDLLTIDLAEIYPELKGLRLRGRLAGNRVLPYPARDEIAREEDVRAAQALVWIDDAVELFFIQIQGSGQVDLDDGQRIRVGFADQNGHPYRSVGKWLADHGELKLEQTSMQGIKTWAGANPQRMQQMLNANPSVVFFREVPLSGSGPPGAMGVALTPERSIAVDAKTTPLGAPVWLATTQPGSEQALFRLTFAQDTGGAIRGPVRADFYWGSGSAAGEQAGRMRQRGRMWILLPLGQKPDQALR